jgi:hypothetical protein
LAIIAALVRNGASSASFPPSFVNFPRTIESENSPATVKMVFFINVNYMPKITVLKLPTRKWETIMTAHRSNALNKQRFVESHNESSLFLPDTPLSSSWFHENFRFFDLAAHMQQLRCARISVNYVWCDRQNSFIFVRRWHDFVALVEKTQLATSRFYHSWYLPRNRLDKAAIQAKRGLH